MKTSDKATLLFFLLAGPAVAFVVLAIVRLSGG